MATSRRKWAVDFANASSSTIRRVPDPIGFRLDADDQDDTSRAKARQGADFKSKMAWGMATSPLKSIGMIAFMLWMSGRTVQIFSIMMTLTAISQPVLAIHGANQVFAPFKDKNTDILLPKLVYYLLNIAGMGVGLWKLNSLGLLPTRASDWASSLPVPTTLEFSAGGPLLT